MNTDLRVLFGKRELEIIEKHRSNVKLSASEKTRLSGPIKRKIMAIESWKPVKLDKGISVKDKINIALDAILSAKIGKKIKRIYLFGSQVTGKAKFDSDIDLAIDIEAKNPALVSVDIEMLIPQKYEEVGKYDICILDNLPFKDDVMKNGKLLYSNKRGRIKINRLFTKNA